MNRKKGRRGRPQEEPLSRWRKLGRGPKWVIVTVTPLIIAAAIPGIAPWVVDRVTDIADDEPLTARSEAYPTLVPGGYFATGSIITEPDGDLARQSIVESGAQMRTSGHKIVLTSRRAAQLDIEGIVAVVEKREAPLSGTAHIVDPQGSADTALIDFSLDTPGKEIPAFVPADAADPGKPSTPYLANGKIRYVEQGKQEHLMIRATTKTCHCQWRVRITYSYRGARKDITVPPVTEKPFATTAWGPHKVQYVTDGMVRVHRHDCVAQPSACRTG